MYTPVAVAFCVIVVLVHNAQQALAKSVHPAESKFVEPEAAAEEPPKQEYVRLNRQIFDSLGGLALGKRLAPSSQIFDSLGGLALGKKRLAPNSQIFDSLGGLALGKRLAPSSQIFDSLGGLALGKKKRLAPNSQIFDSLGGLALGKRLMPMDFYHDAYLGVGENGALPGFYRRLPVAFE